MGIHDVSMAMDMHSEVRSRDDSTYNVMIACSEGDVDIIIAYSVGEILHKMPLLY